MIIKRDGMSKDFDMNRTEQALEKAYKDFYDKKVIKRDVSIAYQNHRD